MSKLARFFAPLALVAVACAAAAQGMPPPEFPGPLHGPIGPPQQTWQSMNPAEREQWREERRQRRDSWREMSPEERHQLRRDIRDAREHYPKRPRRFAP